MVLVYLSILQCTVCYQCFQCLSCDHLVKYHHLLLGAQQHLCTLYKKIEIYTLTGKYCYFLAGFQYDTVKYHHARTGGFEPYSSPRAGVIQNPPTPEVTSPVSQKSSKLELNYMTQGHITHMEANDVTVLHSWDNSCQHVTNLSFKTAWVTRLDVDTDVSQSEGCIQYSHSVVLNIAD